MGKLFGTVKTRCRGVPDINKGPAVSEDARDLKLYNTKLSKLPLPFKTWGGYFFMYAMYPVANTKISINAERYSTNATFLKKSG
jgi:hypothetical protein